MPKQVHFKAVTNYYKLADVDVVKNGITIHTSLTGNSKFPNPPVDMATLKIDIESLSA